MRTLVLSPRYTDDSNAMWRAATDRGWDVVRVRSYRSDSIDSAVAKKGPVLYGETLLADALAEPLGLVVVEPSSSWLPTLPETYRKRDVKLSTLGKARALRVPTFVKPVDEKIFKSKVYDDGAMIDPDLSKNAAGEWPLDDAEAKEVMRFANELLGDQRVELPEALVVDVGKTADRGWCVVEANPCWASGLCGCDPRAALDVCAVASKPKHEPSRWSRQPKG
jgi:hypothetical protein